MNEQRKLVGRRFRDFYRKDIHFQLTFEEIIWHSFIIDPRYAPLLDRRFRIRRREEVLRRRTNEPMTTSIASFIEKMSQ